MPSQMCNAHLVRFLIISFVADAGVGQLSFAQSANKIRISKLVIERCYRSHHVEMNPSF
jgi:hypothetical protein